MNKLVLIGNGFDLAHKLETKYQQFLLAYVNEHYLISSNSDSAGYKDILMQINFSRNVPKIPFDSMVDFINGEKTYGYKIHTFNDFFRDLLFNDYDSWVDIEAKYYRFLTDISDNYSTPKITQGIVQHRRPVLDSQVEELNICFNEIKVRLATYLNDIDDEDTNQNPEIKAHIDKLLFKLEPDNILFVNFNYTSTVDLYINNTNQYYKNIKYIHGKLKDDSNPLIFGYGDEIDDNYEKIERLNKNEFLKNIKSFGYFKTNNYKELSTFLNTSNFEVHIMGHSCGISDRLLLNHIFDHPGCSSIKIYYHQKDEVNDDYFEKIQEISRHFKGLNKSKMRDRILIHSECVPLVKYT